MKTCDIGQVNYKAAFWWFLSWTAVQIPGEYLIAPTPPSEFPLTLNTFKEAAMSRKLLDLEGRR